MDRTYQRVSAKLVILLFMIGGCSSDNENIAGTKRQNADRGTFMQAKAVVAEIEGLWERVGWNEDDPMRYHPFTEVVELTLNNITDTELLKEVFYEFKKQYNTRNDYLAQHNPTEADYILEMYWPAQCEVLCRLEDIGGDSGAKALVELLADRSLGWDGEGIVNIGQAITTCGRPALKYLANIPADHEKKDLAEEFCQCIRGNTIFGP